jgi:hypothetical protein
LSSGCILSIRNRHGRKKITEKELVDLWNDKRSQLTRAQLNSVIALAVLTFLTITGDLQTASMAEKIFAAAFLVTVGALSNLTQFAIIRESQGIVSELSKISNVGPIGKSIGESGQHLSLTLTVMVVFSVALFASFAWVVLAL